MVMETRCGAYAMIPLWPIIMWVILVDVVLVLAIIAMRVYLHCRVARQWRETVTSLQQGEWRQRKRHNNRRAPFDANKTGR